MKPQFKILILIFLLLGVGIFSYFYFLRKPLEKEQEIEQEIPEQKFSFEDPQLQEIYERALAAEEKIRKDKNDYNAYLEAGLAWKSLGDLTNQQQPAIISENQRIFYRKSRDIYRKQTEVFPNFWVPWLNLANLQRILGEYSETEKSFKKAIEISPGEGMLYLRLIELYRYNLQKSEQEIINVYEQALERVVENINVLISYASYLYDVGRKQESLKYYQMAFERHPEAVQIEREIQRIKKELGQ